MKYKINEKIVIKASHMSNAWENQKNLQSINVVVELA
jgi:hypothetical protein